MIFFVKALLVSFCRRDKDTYIQNLKNSEVFFAFFKAFLTVFMHQEGPALLSEWLKGQKLHPARKALCYAGKRFFEFLKKKKNPAGIRHKGFFAEQHPLARHCPLFKEKAVCGFGFFYGSK